MKQFAEISEERFSQANNRYRKMNVKGLSC